MKIYMERAVTYDLFAAARPPNLTMDRTSSSSFISSSPSKPEVINSQRIRIESINTMLNFFSNTKVLLDILRSLDDYILSLDAGSFAGGFSLMSTAGTISGPSTPSATFTPASTTSPYFKSSPLTATSSAKARAAGPVNAAYGWMAKNGFDLASWIRAGMIELDGKTEYKSIFRWNSECPGAHLVIIIFLDQSQTCSFFNLLLF
jgi:hypothetical protein